MNIDEKLREQYRQEPWGQFLINIGMDPVNTEPSARRVAEAAAKQLGIGLDKQEPGTFEVYSVNEEESETDIDCAVTQYLNSCCSEELDDGDVIEFEIWDVTIMTIKECLPYLVEAMPERAADNIGPAVWEYGWLESCNAQSDHAFAEELQTAVANFLTAWLGAREKLPTFGRVRSRSPKQYQRVRVDSVADHEYEVIDVRTEDQS